MRLTSFSVQNYRGFADRTEVELRPLTLLFGYNSAGKSALLRWLPIVAASMDPDATSALALDVDAARGASFDDLLSRYTSSDKLSLGLRWQDVESEDDLRVDMRLLWEARQRQQLVEHLHIERSLRSARHEVDAVSTLDLESPLDRRRYTVQIDALPPHERELAFRGLLLMPVPFEPVSVATMLGKAYEWMSSLRSSVHWLTAVRAVSERSRELGSRPRRLGSDGMFAGDYLAHDRIANGQVLATVSAWFQQATSHSLDVQLDTVAGKDRFSLMLTPTAGEAPVRIPLPDTGEGMAQVLPVLVLGALARHGQLGNRPFVLVEHPELHLHPAIHADLAGFFCELARDLDGPTTVLETHSENVLLRVQLAIARGELDPARVIIHWVRSLPEGPAVVETITFDDMARPQGDWPPRVFSSDIRQARELLEIRRKRGTQ
jgi:predicted ATPase